MNHQHKPNILWITPEKQGGIRTYSEALFPTLVKDDSFTFLEPLIGISDSQVLNTKKQYHKVDLIHIQHEYGLFGGKLPWKYRFPKWLSKVKNKFPNAKIVLTAHTVLPTQFNFPETNWVKTISNKTWVPFAHRLWQKKYWEGVNLIITHSKFQKKIFDAESINATEVPHFVAQPHLLQSIPREESLYFKKLVPNRQNRPVISVFGYFNFEKGQDIAIKAMAILMNKIQAYSSELPSPILLLAGGVRIKSDEKYFEYCKNLIKDLNQNHNIIIGGFVPPHEIHSIYRNSRLILAPFRYTSGSGSLSHAIGQHAPILASNLLLNNEINERVPHSMFTFKSEDEEELAQKLFYYLYHCTETEKAEQHQAVQRYSHQFSISQISKLHLNIYHQLLK